jgi:hypothetical protein
MADNLIVSLIDVDGKNCLQSHRKGAKNAKDMRKLGVLCVLAMKKSFWFAYQHLIGGRRNFGLISSKAVSRLADPER